MGSEELSGRSGGSGAIWRRRAVGNRVAWQGEWPGGSMRPVGLADC